MVEFEQTVELDVSLEVLQYIGVADHSSLKNREQAEQHPISSIAGLVEQHNAYDKKLSDIDDTLKDHTDTLASNDEELTEHTQTLTFHGETLADYGKTLQDHGDTLEDYGKTLRQHGQTLEDLVEFSRNVATTENVEEVLGNVE